MCAADRGNSNAALRFAEHSHNLRLGKSGLLHRNLLDKRYEKILRLSPANFGDDYPITGPRSETLIALRPVNTGAGISSGKNVPTKQMDAVPAKTVPIVDMVRS
jgi:hypothetical protein